MEFDSQSLGVYGVIRRRRSDASQPYRFVFAKRTTLPLPQLCEAC